MFACSRILTFLFSGAFFILGKIVISCQPWLAKKKCECFVLHPYETTKDATRKLSPKLQKLQRHWALNSKTFVKTESLVSKRHKSLVAKDTKLGGKRLAQGQLGSVLLTSCIVETHDLAWHCTANADGCYPKEKLYVVQYLTKYPDVTVCHIKGIYMLLPRHKSRFV